MKTKQVSPLRDKNLANGQKKKGTIWGALKTLCRKIHLCLYLKHDLKSAKRYLQQLQALLPQLPANDLAILREEAEALCHELQGNWPRAILHRRKEIQLMERLQRSVQNSMEQGEYKAELAKSILAGRDSAVLAERRRILRSLEKRIDLSVS